MKEPLRIQATGFLSEFYGVDENKQKFATELFVFAGWLALIITNHWRFLFWHTVVKSASWVRPGTTVKCYGLLVLFWPKVNRSVYWFLWMLFVRPINGEKGKKAKPKKCTAFEGKLRSIKRHANIIWELNRQNILVGQSKHFDRSSTLWIHDKGKVRNKTQR